MQRLKILYIEDDADSRKLVRRILPEDDCELYEAKNALEGLEIVKQVMPDIVLVDLDLPDLTGLEFSTKLKADPLTQNISIIAVTGKKEFSNQERMVIAGCDGFIPKPFDITNFYAKIRELHEKHGISRSPIADEYLKYQAELVAKLEEKVRLLQDRNEALSRNYELLRDKEAELRYRNDMLLRLHNVSNLLHKIRSIEEFIHTYPKLIVEHLGFKRAILFQIDLEMNRIYPVSWAGFTDEEIKNYQLPFEKQLIDRLLAELEIFFITDMEQIQKMEIGQLFPFLRNEKKKGKFAMGYVGPQLNHHILERDEVVQNNNLSRMMEKLYQNITPDNLQLELEKYVSGYLFKFTGILYVDNGEDGLPIHDFDRQILSILLESSKVVYENISLIQILQKLYLKAGQDAITDPLTGIYNYRYFINQLIREINRAQRYKIPLSLVMIDIDFFKFYNDNFGHLAGDYVLRKVAQLLTENTRMSDIVARYGGEEFVIILPEVTKEEAGKLADKLRKIIESYPFSNQEKMPDGNLTISLGIATFPEDGQLPETLIECADKALYEAKNSGRNQVRIFRNTV